MQIIKVLNTVQALGADAAISNGILTLAGVRIPLENIKPGAVRIPYVAETLQVNTGVVTASNGATYGYNVLAKRTVDGQLMNFTVPLFTSDASTTRTEVATAIKNTLNQFGDKTFTVALTGAAPNQDFTVTANTGYAIFSSGTPSAATGVITTTVTTPGVIGNGSGALILANANGGLSNSDIVSTNNYSTYYIKYRDPAVVKTRNEEFESINELVLYVNEGATNFATLCGTYGTLTQALLGYQATWSAAAATGSAVSNGVLTLGGTDIFYGNSDTNIGLQANDVILVGTGYYPLVSILTGTTAATNGTPNDQTTAATQYIKVRSVL